MVVVNYDSGGDDDDDDDGEHDDSGGDCDGQAFKGFTAKCLLSRAKLLLIRTLSNTWSLMMMFMMSLNVV